uniref:Uncharacterized protein n=1 Tax=Salix viminalis TaxID=40686 RepID=A0A6N2L7F6_SALVM
MNADSLSLSPTENRKTKARENRGFTFSNADEIIFTLKSTLLEITVGFSINKVSRRTGKKVRTPCLVMELLESSRSR